MIQRIKQRISSWMLRDIGNDVWWRSGIGQPILDGIEWIERVIYCHHNARVLVDMESRFSHVLSHVTNRMSKAYYSTDAMIAECDAAMERVREQAVIDFIDDLAYVGGGALSREQMLRIAGVSDDGTT